MYYYSVQPQGPEAVFPIGEVRYLSNTTNVEEKVPFCIEVLVHRACDLMLLHLTEALADARILKKVKEKRIYFILITVDSKDSRFNDSRIEKEKFRMQYLCAQPSTRSLAQKFLVIF